MTLSSIHSNLARFPRGSAVAPSEGGRAAVRGVCGLSGCIRRAALRADCDDEKIVSSKRRAGRDRTGEVTDAFECKLYGKRRAVKSELEGVNG